MKRGKRYVEAAKLVDRASLYEAADATVSYTHLTLPTNREV